MTRPIEIPSVSMDISNLYEDMYEEKRKRAAPFASEYVREVVLFGGKLDGSGGPPDEEPLVDPIAIFDPLVWTHVSGSWTTLDFHGRECVAAADIGEDAIFQTTITIDPGSDWSIAAELAGEVNDYHSGDIVSEGASHTGISLWTTTAGGGSPGTIRSQGISGDNFWTGLDSILLLTVRNKTGNTDIKWWSADIASGAATGALGTGTITVTVPRGQAIYGLSIFDKA